MMNKMSAAEKSRQDLREKRIARWRDGRRSRGSLAEPAPTVPGAFADGLLPRDILDAPLAVSIASFGNPEVITTIRTLWNGEVVDTVNFDGSFPATIHVPVSELFAEGPQTISYEIVRLTGEGFKSDPVVVVIDRTPPHHGNPAPTPQFPAEVVANGITPEYLLANNDEVLVTVPKYGLMEAGDTVYPLWYAVTLPIVEVTQDDVDAGFVLYAIPGSLIRATGESVGSTLYSLRDRAGNEGIYSNPAIVDVWLTPPPANLQAPEVPLALPDDGLIDRPDVDFGVTVDVLAYDNARIGDVISVAWGNRTLPGGTVTDPSSSFPISVAIPRSVVFSVGGPTVTVSHNVVRGIRTFTSPSITIDVSLDGPGPVDPDPETPENEALLPPNVVGGVSNAVNEIKPEDAGTNAIAIVPLYANAQIGEVIRLYWGSLSHEAAEHTVTQSDIDDGTFPNLEVPAALMDEVGSDPALALFYTIEHAAGTDPVNPVLSVTQPVKVLLSNLLLPAAEFPDANDLGWLTYRILEPKGGARIHIPVYGDMELGDLVYIHWVGVSGLEGIGAEIPGTEWETVPPITVTAIELADGVNALAPMVNIDPIAAEPNYQGSAKVTYTVTKGGDVHPGTGTFVKIDLYQSPA